VLILTVSIFPGFTLLVRIPLPGMPLSDTFNTLIKNLGPGRGFPTNSETGD